MSFNVAIDGPAGAGKSTVAKAVAKEQGFIYVDTGAMYRAMALYFIRKGIDTNDEPTICAHLDEINITLAYEDGAQQVFLNGENVSGLIRTEEVGMATSNVSKYKLVREKMVALQQEIARTADVVMDGRDIGMWVLPNADVKIYLTASSIERARRRHKELVEKGGTKTLEEIEQDIIARDYQDMHRENSPLVQAPDATYLDSSDMNLRQVIDAIMQMIDEKRGRRVIVAKTAGFCFGVKRAVEKVYEQIELGKAPIYTYGPIIHNEVVVNDLDAKGVKVIDTKEELAALKEGVVVIRSHGVGKEIYDILNGNGVEIVDATCPFVKKIHNIVSEQSAEGRQVIIVGDENHPEVQGIKGWGNCETKVIKTAEEFDNLAISHEKRLCLVAQTTFNYNKFQELVEKISRKSYDINVLNTICNATQERQVEAKKVASQVDVMLVIGGKNSSNTQKLYEICQNECKNTFYIQTIGDLNPECISSACNVGITAGASTPNNIIEEVHTNVRVKF